MKKFFSFLILLACCITAFAFETNFNFSFKEQKDADAYQQYVGQSFFVRKAFGSLETWKKTGFNFSDDYLGKTYTITKVTVKDVTVNNEPNREIAIVAVENGTKRKIKFKGYEEVSVKVSLWSGIKQWP